MSVFLGHILRFCVVILLSAFGTNMAFAVPTSATNITYFQPETTHSAQGGDVGFAARAPPLAIANVAVTGGVTVMRGSAFTLHGQETVAALFGFEGDLNAPKGGVDPRDVGGINGVRPHQDGPAAGGRKPQYHADGGLDRAKADFESVVGGQYTTLPNGNLRGTGPNGENIIFNPQSSGGLNPNVTGPPTIYVDGAAIRYD